MMDPKLAPDRGTSVIVVDQKGTPLPLICRLDASCL